MTDQRRLLYLKIGVAAAVGLLLLDSFVIEPAFKNWKEQNARITALEQKVAQGHQLLSREAALRQHWTAMQKANLPEDVSAAAISSIKALDRGKLQSGITLTNLTPQAWQVHDSDGYDTLEYRFSATGSQANLCRFLYELETETSVPLNLEEFELATRDARGDTLNLTARITFLRLRQPSKIP